MLNGGRSALPSGYRRQTHEENHENTIRKNTTPAKVYCMPEEDAKLKEWSAAPKLSTSELPTKSQLHPEVKHVLNNRRVRELAKIKGTLAGLGGLLKLWLTNDPRTEEFGAAAIRAVPSKIGQTQDEMFDVMRFIVMPGSAWNK